MLAEELQIHDAESLLWETARPLLGVALRLDHDDTYVWHGWHKQQIEAFLKQLPSHCTLMVGVWAQNAEERDILTLACVCEVIQGEIVSIRTFESLVESSLPPIQELEPGFEHAFELMHAAGLRIAPVAWALFTDKATWDEWLFTDGGDDDGIDKGALLTAFAQQGRCVIMGSQASHHH